MPPPSLLGQPHHDGSDACVPERPDELGGEAVVRLRVPREAGATSVSLRHVQDGEPKGVEAVVDAESDTEVWWRATFPVTNPSVRYRWLAGNGSGYTWLNGTGPVAHDPSDGDDFVLSLDAGGPDWHLGSVVYEIFPDRFAASGDAADPPAWAVPRGWDDLPSGRGPDTAHEWFGGDLAGIEQRLDHLERLGVSALYLTPVFPAGSTHRYDASSFAEVDPLLGGDRALASLADAAHARGLRVVGDLTLNHCGNGHPWFRQALDDPGSPERGFFIFDERLPNGYESWFDVPSLPKLDWRSAELERRMLEVVRHWLSKPFSLDGWRIDVANMVARWRDVDLNHAVQRAVRRAFAEARPDAVLIAEHGHDYRGDLGGGGWHGAMNYAGFLRPVWSWLRGDDLPGELQHAFWGVPAGLRRIGGAEAVTSMRAFRAGLPWPSVLHSWPLLDSHDTPRFKTVAGSRERHVVGIGLQMTTPGVPMVFAGDELGLEGDWGEDARRTMPWDRPESWDTALLEEYRRLIALRRSSDALARGGIRYAFVGEEAIAYLRESRDERLLCLASRASHAPVSLPLAALSCTSLEPLYGGGADCAGGVATLPGDGPSFHVWRLT